VGVKFSRTGTMLALAALAMPLGLARADAATTTLALWNLDEAAGATVMHDSSGNAVDGSIGSAVVTGGLSNGVNFYTWTNVKPTEPPAKPERLVRVEDSRLNFGTKNFAISFRYRTTHPFGNIMQKGQAKTVGGQIKFQLPKGNVSCMVRGTSQRAVRSVGSYRDGLWHTVRCERNATGIIMTISDAAGNVVETKKLNGPTGNFSNRFPFTIGGKPECDQITVTCDYFAGDIDWVKIETW
jgi:hypothetical protein